MKHSLRTWIATTATAWCVVALAGRGPAAELVGVESLRAAVRDLTAAFPDQYPQGPRFLAQLDAIVERARGTQGDEASRCQADLETLRRTALVANPLVSGRPILFVTRKQYRPDHHNTETMFQTGEINTGSFEGPGALKTLEWDGQGQAKVATLLEVPHGVVRDPDVHFDGRRILVALRRDRDDDYHIYELNADGSGLRQLTFGSGISDIDPIYLPSEEILFTSTRQPKYCMCNRHIMGNLFKMDAEGKNLRQLGRNTLHEGHASLLPDGRVLYDRWEYVDRNFGNAQGVWTIFPDGTQPAVWYGNSNHSPGGVLDARAIPGSEAIIATFSSCHDRPWGALAIVDRRRGVDGRAPVLRTWPPSAIDLVDRGNYDTFIQVQPKYEDPYPLSDKYFLCSRMVGRGEEMGIFLLDVFGNEVLLHAEAPGCYDPMPLGPRPRPPVIAPRVEWARNEGSFLIGNVYVGTGMEAIPRGTVKAIRVVESPEKRFWTHPAWDGGTGTQAPGMNWDDFNNKRILGTAPVEADGSAYFTVPANRFVYFQLLDERGMMIQSMRSATAVQPGETTGCVGCHEGRRAAAAVFSLPLAARRGPSRLQPWYGPPRNFDYLAEVQPVLDRHCVACHDYGQAAGKKLNLAGDVGMIFNTSYVELRTKGYVRVVGAGPPKVLPPKSWGSHASPLVKILFAGHGDPQIDPQVKLDREAIDRIITWIDLNAPYYPDYATAFPDNLFGRAPIDMGQAQRLAQLVGVDLADRGHVAAVSFTRPRSSACLARLDERDPRRQEALAILEEGKRRLALSASMVKSLESDPAKHGLQRAAK
jgi:hypothetical protein